MAVLNCSSSFVTNPMARSVRPNSSHLIVILKKTPKPTSPNVHTWLLSTNDPPQCSSTLRPIQSPKKPRPISRITPKMPLATTPGSFGFKNLMETSMVSVQRAESTPLNVPWMAPFTSATSRLDKVENVAVRIELSNGWVGWAKIPILPFVTEEDQPTAMAEATEAREMLRSSSKMTFGTALGEISGILPGHDFASVRAVVEMALIDAVASDIGVPLWRLFGGVSNSITTDITIPIVPPLKLLNWL